MLGKMEMWLANNLWAVIVAFAGLLYLAAREWIIVWSTKNTKQQLDLLPDRQLLPPLSSSCCSKLLTDNDIFDVVVLGVFGVVVAEVDLLVK